mmetsp:Transcript_17515/g.49262  ORF Transcript_17515/g.49262 Transcript_17515/m.49262 type:complete len:200 (+) Transcript_17515:375-974(+)
MAIVKAVLGKILFAWCNHFKEFPVLCSRASSAMQYAFSAQRDFRNRIVSIFTFDEASAVSVTSSILRAVLYISAAACSSSARNFMLASSITKRTVRKRFSSALLGTQAMADLIAFSASSYFFATLRDRPTIMYTTGAVWLSFLTYASMTGSHSSVHAMLPVAWTSFSVLSSPFATESASTDTAGGSFPIRIPTSMTHSI